MLNKKNGGRGEISFRHMKDLLYLQIKGKHGIISRLSKFQNGGHPNQNCGDK